MYIKNYILLMLFMLYALISPAHKYPDTDSVKNLLESVSGMEKVRLLNEIADSCRSLGNYQGSINYYNKAGKLADKIGNYKSMISSMNRIAGVYRMTGKYGQAFQFYYQSVELAKRYNCQVALQDSYRELSRTYSILNEYQKAREYLAMYEMIRDSISLIKSEQAAGNELQDNVKTSEQEMPEDKHKPGGFDHLEEQINKDMILTYFFIFLGIVILIVSYAIYDSYRKRRSKGDDLIKKIDLELERIKTDMISEDDASETFDYTRQIQESIRPSIEFTRQLFPNSFIYYEPRKNVGGDFYWFEKKKNNIYVSTVDCSGYGISVAFLSHITHNILNSSLKEQAARIPANIIDELNMDISYRFHKDIQDKNVSKTIKISLCLFNMKDHTLQYAGADSTIYVIRNKEPIELKTDPLPVGTYVEDTSNRYNNYEFKLKEGDTIYMFTDGFANQLSLINEDDDNNDQFKKLLQDIHSMPMNEQKEILKKTVEQWEEEIDQMDDILVVGLRI